jgi:exosome complex RNA-binding protein Rrp42 (RNase PH superfamily)
MDDVSPPLKISLQKEFRTIKVGLVFKDKLCDSEHMYVIVDPEKEEEEQFLDAQILVSIESSGKTKINMHNVGLNSNDLSSEIQKK